MSLLGGIGHGLRILTGVIRGALQLMIRLRTA